MGVAVAQHRSPNFKGNRGNMEDKATKRFDFYVWKTPESSAFTEVIGRLRCLKSQQ